MPKRTLMEESQLLHYAFVISKLVNTINRYMRSKQLSKQDKDVIDMSLEFINRAIDGQSLISRIESKLAPDIESIEIYGYVTNAMDNEIARQNDFEKILKERLSSSSSILRSLKENNLSEKEFQTLEEEQSFYRSVAAVLVHESTVPHQEENWDNLS